MAGCAWNRGTPDKILRRDYHTVMPHILESLSYNAIFQWLVP